MWRLYRDCLLSGGEPLDVYVWRRAHGARHPLPARSATLVFNHIATPAGRAILADKLALAERLSELGLPSPPLRALYTRRSAVGPDLWDGAAEGTGLFLKPRHGSGGRGAFALTSIQGRLHMDGVESPEAAAERRIIRLLETDDLLVQERLVAADELADLAYDGRAPVLRLVTSTVPGKAPSLHSALLTVARPGRNPANFLQGAWFAPLDLATGTIVGGISLEEPRRCVDRLGSSGPRLAGRTPPRLDEAFTMALRAMAALPPLPLIHWDIILSNSGPVILEGNCAGNWILANLPATLGLESYPLESVLLQWTRPSASLQP